MTRLFLSFLALFFTAQFSVRAAAAEMALAKSEILESNVIYLCVGTVAAGLADKIKAADATLAGTNKIIGTVLDLRFADGDDAEAVKATANLFSARKLPLAILVNSETRDAAAALATALREERAGLIFGDVTNDLKPDIAVTVNLTDEKKFLKNPYATLATNEINSLSATNDLLPFVDHLSEADLVRQKVKDGEEDEDAEPASRPAPPKPVIRDPVLARATDLLKGLAIVRAAHN